MTDDISFERMALPGEIYKAIQWVPISLMILSIPLAQMDLSMTFLKSNKIKSNDIGSISLTIEHQVL